MRLNVLGKTNTLFGNVYALRDDGTLYAGRRTAENFWLSDCQVHLEDLEWTRYAKSKAPKHVFEWPVQRVIEVNVG